MYPGRHLNSPVTWSHARFASGGTKAGNGVRRGANATVVGRPAGLLTVRTPPLRAFLSATEPVLARPARRVALGPFPSAGTRARGVLLAARTVVETVALVLALLAEQSPRAQRLALYACPKIRTVF